jgi:hypothetical protein
MLPAVIMNARTRHLHPVEHHMHKINTAGANTVSYEALQALLCSRTYMQW